MRKGAFEQTVAKYQKEYSRRETRWALLFFGSLGLMWFALDRFEGYIPDPLAWTLLVLLFVAIGANIVVLLRRDNLLRRRYGFVCDTCKYLLNRVTLRSVGRNDVCPNCRHRFFELERMSDDSD